MGLGSAYMDGAKFATGEYLVIMDADLSHHPKYIPSMIQKMKESKCDIVLGSRYIQNGGIYGWSFMRKLTSRVANFITSESLGVEVSDFTNSFRLYKKDVFNKLLKEVTNKGFGFQMDIIVRAKWRKLNIQQVPIVFVDRIYGQSKLGTNEIYLFLKGIWKLMNTDH